MSIHELLKEVCEPNDSKIVLLVADGLGGLPQAPGTKTELESARTPNLDACVREGMCGLSIPILPGITPGSGAGHLALFGYDPIEARVGRAVLEALGIHFALNPQDVAVYGTFCTVDETGAVCDLRGGRPTTEHCTLLCNKLQSISLPGVEIFIEPLREERFILVLRGTGLGGAVRSTNPRKLRARPLEATGQDSESQRTAQIINQFVREAAKSLAGDGPTNMLLLHDFAKHPKITPMREIYGLKGAAIAVYPLYKGLARLVGMDVPDCGSSLGDQIEALRQLWSSYDFFFLHYKYTDSTGQDRNFAAKVEMIERLDAEIPRIKALNPDVLIVTGDHSTPSSLGKHSWHPVPTLLWSNTCRPDPVVEFGESYCLRGGLGQFQAKYLLPLAMAHAERLGVFQ